MKDSPRLIAHVIHRLDFGGLENGLVNLINRIPQDRYHHAVICMTDYSDFAQRITNPQVSLHALHKVDGKDTAIYLRLWKLLRKLGPDIVHTRNLSALEAGVIAALAGVPGRVHGEHGRDSYDIDGTNKKYLRLRKMCQPFIQRFIPLSKDLEKWLEALVHVPKQKIRQIYNGVDQALFYPPDSGRQTLPCDAFSEGEKFVIGTVGRIQEVKDQLTLVRAVAALVSEDEGLRGRVCLAIIGDGPMMPELAALVESMDIQDITWLAGARNDIPELMRAMDLFVLPSKAEGISNTILEAMASGLPVVATAVGGNTELVVQDETGDLVPPSDPIAMATVLKRFISEADRGQCFGRAGRRRVEEEFSLEAMVAGYLGVYDELAK